MPQLRPYNFAMCWEYNWMRETLANFHPCTRLKVLTVVYLIPLQIAQVRNQEGASPPTADREATCRAASPGDGKNRLPATAAPLAEGLRGQLRLAAFAVVLEVLFAPDRHDDRLTVQAGSAGAEQKGLAGSRLGRPQNRGCSRHSAEMCGRAHA